jgi:hypothetical protein
VYHERVPSSELLPPIAPAAPVLLDPPASLVDAAASDLFARLVPFDVHLKASQYSDQKDAVCFVS